MTENNGKSADRTWDILMKMTVPATLAAAAAIIHHEVRLGKIEETRFTIKDASVLESKLIHAIRDSTPSPWTRQHIERILIKMDTLESKMEDLKARSVRLETLVK